MKISSGRRAGAAAAAALVVVSVAGITISSAGAQPASVTANVGVLQLHLDDSGSSISYSGPLAVPASQPVMIIGTCGVSAATGPLLSLAPSPVSPGLGLVSNGLGVRTKNNCSTASGQLSGDEKITVALGTAFGDDIRVDVAELDVEGKHDADLGVALDGGPVVPRDLFKSNDNGPDSGVGDNDRAVITDDFTSLTLSPVGGEVSLEGGGDGTYEEYLEAEAVGPIGQSIGSADTIFQLVGDFERSVDCEQSIEATPLGDSASAATFTRALNDGATTPDDCDDIGVTFQILDAGVLLVKSTAGVHPPFEEQAVNAEVEIEWAPQTAEVPLPARQINFQGDPNGVFEDVQWCGEFVPGTGWVHPPDVPWCLISDNQELLHDGTVQQTQTYDGQGDPMWR